LRTGSSGRPIEVWLIALRERIDGYGGWENIPKGKPEDYSRKPCPCGSGKKYKHCHGK